LIRPTGDNAQFMDSRRRSHRSKESSKSRAAVEFRKLNRVRSAFARASTGAKIQAEALDKCVSLPYRCEISTIASLAISMPGRGALKLELTLMRKEHL
jgi:hypothetical protein